MVSTPVLLDTNILIDYLRGIPAALAVCNQHSDRAISIITWMEVIVGATSENEDQTRAFLRNFHTLPLSSAIAERAVLIRRGSRLKLPDAIIQATAEEFSRILLTRNTRDFPPGTPGIQIPY